MFWALSREPGKTKYVTDVLRELDKVNLIKPLLQQANSHVYVCGSAEMALSVKEAVGEVAGEDAVAALEATNRFHLDIFGKLPAKKEGKPAFKEVPGGAAGAGEPEDSQQGSAAEE